jgi:hypothetical protein
MGTWGNELWDRYFCVLNHVNRGGDELSSILAKFVKERGEVEKEYAKNIRKLVTKFANKTETKQGKETSQSKGFRYNSGTEETYYYKIITDWFSRNWVFKLDSMKFCLKCLQYNCNKKYN